MSLEGICLKCGSKWYGWELLSNPYCSKCGTLLEVSRPKEKSTQTGESPSSQKELKTSQRLSKVNAFRLSKRGDLRLKNGVVFTPGTPMPFLLLRLVAVAKSTDSRLALITGNLSEYVQDSPLFFLLTP